MEGNQLTLILCIIHCGCFIFDVHTAAFRIQIQWTSRLLRITGLKMEALNHIAKRDNWHVF